MNQNFVFIKNLVKIIIDKIKNLNRILKFTFIIVKDILVLLKKIFIKLKIIKK